MLVRIVLAAALAELCIVPAARTASRPAFFVGFTEDLPKEIGGKAVRPAAGLGARSLRLTLMWSPGQAQLSADDKVKLGRAIGAARAMRIVLAVYADAGSKAPQDAASRGAYCTYVRKVLTRFPSVRNVAVWNEPNKNRFWSPQVGAPAAYEALLARCYDVLHAAFGPVNVIGLQLSPWGNDNSVSTSPVQFIRGVGEAYRASGRAKPILDTVGHHAYPVTNDERPWRRHIGNGTIAEGDWNKLMYSLWLAFNGTAQPIPGQQGVSIWYLEDGFQTAIDSDKAAAYTGTENVAVVPAWAGGEPDAPPPPETSAAPDQGTQVLDAIRLASCQPHVGAFFNFLLADEPRLEGWQSGVLRADRSRKPSYAEFAQAIAEANDGTVACDALKGGRPSADFMPPTAPGGATGYVAGDPLRVILSWQPSADDASAVAYRISRNGNLVATTAETTWTDTAITAGQSYAYVVRAVDSAGNLSDPAAPVTVVAPLAAASRLRG
jgi:hypothetical protein